MDDYVALLWARVEDGSFIARRHQMSISMLTGYRPNSSKPFRKDGTKDGSSTYVLFSFQRASGGRTRLN
jgi:hypothetical protein